MPIELRWLVSTAASSLHAAEAVARGTPLVDRPTGEAIAAEARGLMADLDNLGLARDRFFAHAAAQATLIDAPSQWAKVVLGKLLGPTRDFDLHQQLARRFVALQAAFSAANPRALEELELRAEPLRRQWEARGPGLWAALARRIDPQLLVESADVVLVQPVAGGGGTPHALYNSVRIEAVLTNPLDALPEVVRLGWLLAQLNRDVPKFHGGLSASAAIAVWPLAMIPPVLAAAAEVELARADRPTLTTALAAWSGTGNGGTTQILAKWWDTYEQSNPAWPVALGALERMLSRN